MGIINRKIGRLRYPSQTEKKKETLHATMDLRHRDLGFARLARRGWSSQGLTG
jgi:hypothetical protein